MTFSFLKLEIKLINCKYSLITGKLVLCLWEINMTYGKFDQKGGRGNESAMEA